MPHNHHRPYPVCRPSKYGQAGDTLNLYRFYSVDAASANHGETYAFDLSALYLSDDVTTHAIQVEPSLPLVCLYIAPICGCVYTLFLAYR